MRNGCTDVRLLSDGTIKFDGGTMFGSVPKTRWEEAVTADRKNRISLGLNCLLIRANGLNFLVDTGVGTKDPEKLKELYGPSSGRLNKALKDNGLAPKDVHGVILTHLHFDHSGGCTKVDRSGKIMPAFPRARYFVQRACWEAAVNPDERSHFSHQLQDFLPLEENNQLELLDGDTEIVPGVEVIVTDGPTKGHQMVLVRNGGEKVALLGNLVPSPHHLQLPWIPALDSNPDKTLQQKRAILNQATEEGWLLVFSHGYEYRAGYLEQRNGYRQLRPVEL